MCHSEFICNLIGITYDEEISDNLFKISLICINGDCTGLGISSLIVSWMKEHNNISNVIILSTVLGDMVSVKNVKERN